MISLSVGRPFIETDGPVVLLPLGPTRFLLRKSNSSWGVCNGRMLFDELLIRVLNLVLYKQLQWE